MLSILFSRSWKWILAGVAVIGLISVLLWQSYEAGIDKVEKEGMENTVNETIKRKQIESDTRKLDNNSVDRELRDNDWLRD